MRHMQINELDVDLKVFDWTYDILENVTIILLRTKQLNKHTDIQILQHLSRNP